MNDISIYKFNYKAYSFHICATFPIPELLQVVPPFVDPVFIQPKIDIGNIPKPIFKNETIQISVHKIIIDIDQVARYSIEDGNKIFICPYEGVSEKEIRLYLMGSAFEAIMYQRGILPIHGSAIVYNNQAFVFSGISGCGKSTLAAWFVKEGYQMLCDDVAVITLNNDSKVMVHPGYPQLKLWSDSLGKFGDRFVSNTFSGKAIKKHSIYLKEEFCCQAVELKGIFFMETQKQSEICISRISSEDMHSLIDMNIHRLNLMQNSIENQKFVHYKGALNKTTQAYKMIRPEDEVDMEKLFRSIEKYILEMNPSVI